MAEGARLLSEYRVYTLSRVQIPPSPPLPFLEFGGVAEWLKAAVLKTVIGTSLSWVRILPPPPICMRIAGYRANIN